MSFNRLFDPLRLDADVALRHSGGAVLQEESERGTSRSASSYLVFLLGRCAKALPAAVLLALLVLPSRRTLDAAEAALALVCFEFFILFLFFCVVKRCYFEKRAYHHHILYLTRLRSRV